MSSNKERALVGEQLVLYSKVSDQVFEMFGNNIPLENCVSIRLTCTLSCQLTSPGISSIMEVRTMTHLIERRRADEMVHGCLHTRFTSCFQVRMYS